MLLLTAEFGVWYNFNFELFPTFYLHLFCFDAPRNSFRIFPLHCQSGTVAHDLNGNPDFGECETG